MQKRADVLLVVVNDAEESAVVEAFKGRSEPYDPDPEAGKVYRYLGIVNHRRVYLARSAMGTATSGGSLQTVEKAIEDLHPSWVIGLGIAFGMKPEPGPQKIGDILVSTRLWLYEPAKLTDDAIIPRGPKPEASEILVGRFRDTLSSWRVAEVHFGLVASGEKLINDLRSREELRNIEPELIGGEMESAGIYVACHTAKMKVHWIVVKAISDWADGSKEHDKKQRQGLAASNATNFVLRMLKGPRAKEHIELAALLKNLPETGEHLLDRENCLTTLDQAWKDRRNLITIVGWAGVGKTALVKRWLERMSRDGWRGAQHAFAWTFSRPAVRDHAVASEEFFSRAIPEFGGDPGSPLPNNPGQRLVKLIRNKRALLILDGLELFQSPPGKDGGTLKNQEIQCLITALAEDNPGLCVVTTRQGFTEPSTSRSLGEQIHLKKMTLAEGIELLTKLCMEGGGPKPEAQDLEEIVKEYDRHALSVYLLGEAIRNRCGGDAKRWKKLSLIYPDGKQSQLAQQAMARYETWLGRGPELQMLLVLGLFNRAAQPAELDELRQEPAIPSLTDAIVDLKRQQWIDAVSCLRRLELLTADGEFDRFALTAPPLVRDYYAEELKNDPHRDASLQGHRRLYHYHKRTVPTKPDNKEEIRRVFPVIFHGCRSGQYAAMLSEFLQKRILRWNVQTRPRFFSTNTHGLWEETLEGMRCFFKEPWTVVVDGLEKPEDRAFVLTSAGACLRALNRFPEAIEAMEKGYELREKHNQWSEAAFALRMLNQAHIAAGDVGKAQQLGKLSVEHADRAQKVADRISSLARYAESLHHGDRKQEALRQFKRALKISQDPKTRVAPEILDGFWEFEYCDLLITLQNYAEARRRASQVLARELACEDPEAHQPLWSGLSNLILGRIDFIAACRAFHAEDKAELFAKARWHFDGAVPWLMRAGESQHLPLGYLARARLSCEMGDWQNTQDDLARVEQVALRSRMHLHMTDWHLLSARLEQKRGDRGKFDAHLKTAKELIRCTGYLRRERECAELENGL